MDILKEKQFIEKSKSDKKAFSLIYKEYAKAVYRFAYLLVGNTTEAEEITSEAFLRAMEKLDQYAFEGKSIKSWLFTITRNITYDRYRKARELPLIENADEYIGTEEDEGKTDVKLQKDLQYMIFQLPEVTREIITLKIWEEYKFEEIAEIVGKNEDAVKKQFYRGVDRLKEMLVEKGYDKGYLVFPILFTNILQTANIKDFLPSDNFINIGSQFINADKLNNLSKINFMNNISKPLQYLISGGAVLATAASVGIIYSIAKSPNVEMIPQGTIIPTEQAYTQTATPSQVTPSTTETTNNSYTKKTIPINRKYINLEQGLSPIMLTFVYPDSAELVINDSNGEDTENTGYRGFVIKGANYEFNLGGFYGSSISGFQYDEHYLITSNIIWGDVYRVRLKNHDVNDFSYTNSYFTTNTECKEQMGLEVGHVPPCGYANLAGKYEQKGYSLFITCKGSDTSVCDEIIKSIQH